MVTITIIILAINVIISSSIISMNIEYACEHYYYYYYYYYYYHYASRPRTCRRAVG